MSTGFCCCGAGHAPPLPTIVGAFKSAATREINRQRLTPGARVWQRGYHERVVRSERELEAIREYILNNPAAWDDDPANPTATVGLVSAPWLSGPGMPGPYAGVSTRSRS
jgi:hypothetical protein